MNALAVFNGAVAVSAFTLLLKPTPVTAPRMTTRHRLAATLTLVATLTLAGTFLATSDPWSPWGASLEATCAVHAVLLVRAIISGRKHWDANVVFRFAQVLQVAMHVWVFRGDPAIGFPLLMLLVLALVDVKIGFGTYTFCSDLLGDTSLDRTKSVVLVSIGTRGDIQPFLALGQRLKERGHHVAFVTLPGFKELVERHGIAFIDMQLDVQAPEDGPWVTGTHVSQVITMDATMFATRFRKILAGLLRACHSVSETHGSVDVIVTATTTMTPALSITEYLGAGTTCVVAKFAPDLPTRHLAVPGVDSQHVPFVQDLRNLFGWYRHWIRIAQAIKSIKLKVTEDDFRKSHLQLQEVNMGKRLEEMGKLINIFAFSGHVVPRPDDYPANACVSGWWFTKRSSATDTLPAQATHLLDTLGESRANEDTTVVCVSFGGMTKHALQFHLVDAVLKALESTLSARANRAHVVVVGAPIPPVRFSNESDNIMLSYVDQIPHELLFPMCDFVVFHGGAGTCARVLEAGIPSIIVPILMWTDQSQWADVLANQHRVSLHVPRTLIDASSRGIHDQVDASFKQRFKDAVSIVLGPDHDQMKARAARLGAKLQAEDGVAVAVDILERIKC